MANLLYITCNIKLQDESRSLTLGYEFLEEYFRWHPQNEVQILDLYRDKIQRVDQDVLDAFERIERGEDYSFLLSEQLRRNMSRIWRLADQFDRCEKYVFVTHSRNLWFPSEFKTYIDAIYVPERTYRLTTHGAKGILRRLNRKSLHLHVVPPYNFGQEQDLSIAYLRSVLIFFGITDQETVIIHGDDPEREDKDAYEEVRRKLLKLARSF